MIITHIPGTVGGIDTLSVDSVDTLSIDSDMHMCESNSTIVGGWTGRPRSTLDFPTDTSTQMTC